jgi:hypothetical protein
MKLWPAALATFGLSVVIVTGGAALLVDGRSEEEVYSDEQALDDGGQVAHPGCPTAPPVTGPYTTSPPDLTPTPPPPDLTPVLPPSDATEAPSCWVSYPGTTSSPGSGPGKFIPLPAEAQIVQVINEGGGPDRIGVQLHNSVVMWTEDGVMVEKRVEKADEAALGPLLTELRQHLVTLPPTWILPSGAILNPINDWGPRGRALYISYGASRIVLAQDGTVTEAHIEPQDEAALQPLLEALEASGP